MPVELLKARVQEAVRRGDAKESALKLAQDNARQTLRRAQGKLRERGYTVTEAYDIAQTQQGDPGEWGVSEWEALASKVEALDEEWFPEPPSVMPGATRKK